MNSVERFVGETQAGSADPAYRKTRRKPMRDDYLSADWARHHGAVKTSVDKLIKTIATGWVRLNAYQFDAPWRHEPCVHD